MFLFESLALLGEWWIMGVVAVRRRGIDEHKTATAKSLITFANYSHAKNPILDVYCVSLKQ